MTKRKTAPKPRRKPAKRSPREDFNQAAFRIVSQATKDK
jgi:hypothetical protein